MVKTFSSGPGLVVTLRPRSSITADPVLTPEMVWMFWTVRGVNPSGSKARTRSEAEPSSSCAARRTASVAAWPAIRAAAYADRVLVVRDGEILETIQLGRRPDHEARPLITRLAELGL